MRRSSITSLLVALFVTFLCADAFAQYNRSAGTSAPRREMVRKRVVDSSTGDVSYREVEQEVSKDRYGNVAGTQHDLAVDGAFEGQTIAVIQLYAFPFDKPRDALKRKGFSVYRWNGAPSVEDLREGLKKANQLWVISDSARHLSDAHISVIKSFYEEGHGVYIWGDNQPYYADANAIGKALIGGEMKGDLMGDKPVGLRMKEGTPGLVPDHLLTTGLEHIYEGITIATIQPNQRLEPLIYGSANNLVAAYYEGEGRRLIFDGGFTRLYNKWDTAGTGRYVVNAAAWLANYERFGDAVVAKEHRKKGDERVE